MHTTEISHPTATDVLLGKGRRIQNHLGNIRLREIGVLHKDSYRGKPNPVKTKIRQEIVDSIRADGGRFLEFNAATSTYRDVGDKRAREKVRHVLSDNGRQQKLRGQVARAVNNNKKKKVATTTTSIPRVQQLPKDDMSSSDEDMTIRRPSLGGEEERKKIRDRQQRLLLLRHGATCKHTNNCPVTPQCSQVKSLWRHLEHCENEHCDVKHCASSKYVLSHYRECEDNSCPECGPVRATLVVSGQEKQRRRSSRRLSTAIVVAV